MNSLREEINRGTSRSELSIFHAGIKWNSFLGLSFKSICLIKTSRKRGDKIKKKNGELNELLNRAWTELRNIN